MPTIAERFNNFKSNFADKFKANRSKAYQGIESFDGKIDQACQKQIKNRTIAKVASRILKALPLILLQVLTATLTHPLIGLTITAGLAIAAKISKDKQYWKTGRIMFDTLGASMAILTIVRGIQAIAAKQLFPYAIYAIGAGLMSGTAFYFGNEANKRATIPLKV